MSRRLAPIAVVALLLCTSVRAEAGFIVNFDAGDFFQDNLGNTGHPGRYDKLTLTGRTGTLDLTSGVAQTVVFSDLMFQVGLTGLPVPPQNFTASQTLTVNGVTRTINQPFQVTIGSVDTVTMFQAPPITFDFGTSGTLTVTALQTPTFSSGGLTFTGTISARFEFTAAPPPPPAAVPAPPALVLLAAGALPLAGFRWLKRRRGQSPVA